MECLLSGKEIQIPPLPFVLNRWRKILLEATGVPSA